MLLTVTDTFSAARRTIKHNHLFLVDDPHGNIPYQNNSGLGLYHLDTRFLSCLELRINDTLPVPLLSSTEVGYLSSLVYTNGQLPCQVHNGEAFILPEETLQVKRESVLCGSLFEKYTLVHYNGEPIPISLSFRLDADFRDIFEVRHLVASSRGTLRPPSFEADAERPFLRFSYEDATGQLLETLVYVGSRIPHILMEPDGPVLLTFETLLYPLEAQEFTLEIQTRSVPAPNGEGKQYASCFEEARGRVEDSSAAWSREATEFISDNDDFNEMLARSHKDLRMLTTQIGEDTFVAAGIPWYTCLFGRDSLITARDCLLLNPALAKSTLQVLARHQGKAHSPWRDEEPGKILHEVRMGELARVGEIPHTPYYGSVDATPLWLILLHDYYRWTHDRATLEALWPHALAALAWIDSAMAGDPRGYLTYETKSTKGLYHQGWKDSQNSAMQEDGVLAVPPIALAEVQGYVYQAKQGLSSLADILGDKALRNRLRNDCRDLKKRFNRDFWVDELGFYALGLDREGIPLRVISTNPGHCLESDLIPVSKAHQVASRLMEPDMFNGWGIRTLSAQARAYNPMSYHNGSIWPHDNAMVARGFAALGRTELVDQLFGGLFDAARLMFYKRLPELFCGFPRDLQQNDPPVKYPVACSPQAWAASAPFSLLQSMLHLKPDLEHGILRIRRPHLPRWINSLRLKNLHVGETTLDLEFKRAQQTVLVDVHHRQGRLDLVLEI